MSEIPKNESISVLSLDPGDTMILVRAGQHWVQLRTTPWVPLQRGFATPESIAKITAGLSDAECEAVLRETEQNEMWMNDLYTVHVNELPRSEDADPDEPALYHVSFRRNDREPVVDWRDVQRIKNDVLGPQCEAIELFPAEERLVDDANQYHIFGYRDPRARIPVGFTHRSVCEGSFRGMSRQRDFPSGDRPEDCKRADDDEAVVTQRVITR